MKNGRNAREVFEEVSEVLDIDVFVNIGRVLPEKETISGLPHD